LFGQPGGASLFGTPAGLFAAKPPAFAAAHGGAFESPHDGCGADRSWLRGHVAGADQEEDGEEGGEEEEEATVPVAKLRNEEEDAVFEADPAKASVYASDVKEWKAKGKVGLGGRRGARALMRRRVGGRRDASCCCGTSRRARRAWCCTGTRPAR
jgi:hypothetical protein